MQEKAEFTKMVYKSVILNDNISPLSILKKIKELSQSWVLTKGMYLYFTASIKYIKTRSILRTNRILEYFFSPFTLCLLVYIMLYFLYSKNGGEDDQNGEGDDRSIQKI